MSFSVIPLFLAATDADATHGGDSPVSAIANTFHFDVATFAAQAINFVIVASVIYYFAVRPVLATMGQRKKEIADGLQYAEEMKGKLADAERQHAETIRAAQGEAKDLIENARRSATEYEEQQRQEANLRIEDMQAKGRELIEIERKKMLEEVRADVAKLVVDASAKVLDRELGAEERTRINQAATREVAGMN